MNKTKKSPLNMKVLSDEMESLEIMVPFFVDN